MKIDMDLIQIYQYTYKTGVTGVDLILDNQRKTVTLGEQDINLAPLQFSILSILMYHARRMVSRQDLVAALNREDNHSGDGVIKNAVSHLRKALNPKGSDKPKIPIGTNKSNYFFEGDIEAIAQVAMIPHDIAPLRPGDHCPTAMGELSSRLYVNFGVEGWLVKPSKADRQLQHARIAVSEQGFTRLRREKAIYDVVRKRAPKQKITIDPDVNFLMPYHQTVLWPVSYRSLNAICLHETVLRDASFEDKLSFMIALTQQVDRLAKIGVIHGDLKPSVIALPESDEPLLETPLLAGLAHGYVETQSSQSENNIDLAFQRLNWSERQTESTVFCAPELLDNASISERSDTFALGVIMYKLFTGNINHHFDAYWHKDIDCEVIRNIISQATRRNPKKRLQSLKELLKKLQSYDTLKKEHEASLEAIKQVKVLKNERAIERQRRPYIRAIIGILSVSSLCLVTLSLQLHKASKKAELEAKSAQAASNMLGSILTETDPRHRSLDDVQSVDEILRLASEEFTERYEHSPRALIEGYTTLARVYRGRTNLRAERDNLLKAINIIKSQNDVDEALLAKNLFAYATIIQHVGEHDDQDPSDYLTQSESIIQQGSALVAKIKSPDHSLITAQIYAKATTSTQRGDYESSYRTLKPWLKLVKENQIAVDLRYYNSVITFAEAASELGYFDEAKETLRWLESYPYIDAPQWLEINRLTAQAKLMYLQNDPDGFVFIPRAINQANAIYKGKGVPEANLHHIYGNFLIENVRLTNALHHQKKAQDIFCGVSRTQPNCKGIDLYIGIILVMDEKFDEAIPKLNGVRELFQEYYKIGIAHTDLHIAMAQIGQKDYAAASQTLQQINTDSLRKVDPQKNWQLHLDAIQILTTDNFSEVDHKNLQNTLQNSQMEPWLIAWIERRAAER